MEYETVNATGHSIRKALRVAGHMPCLCLLQRRLPALAADWPAAQHTQAAKAAHNSQQRPVQQHFPEARCFFIAGGAFTHKHAPCFFSRLCSNVLAFMRQAVGIVTWGVCRMTDSALTRRLWGAIRGHADAPAAAAEE